MSIGFAGMTHLGICSAAAAAAHGFTVVGWDADAALVQALRQGRLPVSEPGLDELVSAQHGRLGFTSAAADLGACDVVYISADVPTNEQSESSLEPIHALIRAVAAVLRDDAVMVILCQVPPGFTRSVGLVPHHRLLYQVETLIFGRAVERAMEPERFIVGQQDPSRPLPAAYAGLLAAYGCPILPMRYESAELAKIAINVCLAASVTVANTLAEIAEAGGADWAEIVPALKLDRRIGPHAYLAPGLGISGGNLERDLRTITGLGEALGTDTGLIRAIVDNSRHRKEWLRQVLEREAQAGDCVAVLGLAYKENTHSVKNSPAVALLERLRGRQVRSHDPMVPEAAVTIGTRCATALDCAQGADVLVIATPWPEYRALDLEALAQAMRGRLILDPFRMLDRRRAAALGFVVHVLGAGPSRAGGEEG
jgi:UDPglucose 6-dehydrogenase